MLPAPYTLTTVDHIDPGDQIHDDHHGVVVVDEIRRGADGYTILGWPPARRGIGRRVSILATATDDITLLADASVAPALAEALSRLAVAANDAARLQWEGDNAHEPEGAAVPDFQPVAAFYGGDDPRLALTIRGRLWSFPVATPVPPAPWQNLAATPAEEPKAPEPVEDPADG